ncbi:type II toxin-antitoxin system Phd/YefM family antitoxin [Blastomonas aquatica]|uniref:Antitoxin n=1 Tax=Blastomonas aquatica TaxID=1510276 RepID=A0ABQ1JGG8_9SPHN|nr:type II toxin-antitoxin system prevent-host-death family antitoxin [Blastomonas aquatica]GGB67798.1 antitoxin [Blastomonas aquatica]
MDVSVTDAKAQLTDLVRRAEAGEEVVLTRHGHAIVRIVPVAPVQSARSRRAVLDAIRKVGPTQVLPGPSAAQSQDHLYGDDGLPQ